MGSSAIRLDRCKNVVIDNLRTTGFDNAIHATNTENLSATNIVSTGDSRIDFDNLIKEFNELIKKTPFDNDNIRRDAVDIAIEVKKNKIDKNKIDLFKNKMQSIYNYIDKASKLAVTVFNIIKIIEMIK